MTRKIRTPWVFLVFIPCFWPIFAFQGARVAAQGTRDLGRSAYKGTKKRISRARRRRINVNAAAHDVAARNSMPKVTERNQLESHFLKLPMELRQQIYDLHLDFHLKEATILIRELNHGGYKLCSDVRAPNYIQGPLQVRFDPSSVFAREPNRLLRLALVCRQIYGEFIEQIYKNTTFKLENHNALLLPTLSVFPQKRLDTLRSLDLQFCIDILVKDLGLGVSQPDVYQRSVTSWTDSFSGKSRQHQKWDALWRLLAALPNLQSLHVAFTRLPGPKSPADSSVFWWILAPLLQFNKREPLAVFEVEWQRSNKDFRISGGWTKAVPFEVVWIPGGRASTRY